MAKTTWINTDIKNFMESNPLASFDDVKAAFPHYADRTISSQRNRAIRTIKGLVSTPRVKKLKTKGRKSAVDIKTYRDSLAKRSSIPRTEFVPTSNAAVAANGNKLHVNLTTAEQTEINRQIAIAEEWVVWLKHVENAPVATDDIDFDMWIKNAPKNSMHRLAKLHNRMNKFLEIYMKLDDSIKNSTLYFQSRQQA